MVGAMWVQVHFTPDYRVIKVHTTPAAPGGERIERVGLPPDPDLYDHLVQHGVEIEVSPLPG